jgi:hypothetical protein
LNSAGNDAEKLAAAFDLVGGRSKRMLEAIRSIGRSGVQGSIDQVVAPISADTLDSLDKFTDTLSELYTTFKSVAATDIQSRLESLGLSPRSTKTFDEMITARANALRELRAKNEAFDRSMISGEDTPQQPSMVQRRLAEAAQSSYMKSLSGAERLTDPLVSIGAARGRNVTEDAIPILKEMNANIRAMSQKQIALGVK